MRTADVIRTVFAIRAVLLACLIATASPAPASAQNAPGISFRSVSSELRERPRGGVIDLFTQQGRAVGRTGTSVDTWFWDTYDRAASAADAGRVRAAARTAAGHEAYQVDVTTLEEILHRYANPIRASQRQHDVSAALVAAIIYVESRGRAQAVSPAGAVGLMQLMPGTASDLGVTDSTDPVQNIAGGTRYLDRLLELHTGDALLALASYNAGPGAVRRAGGVPNYAETRAYVPRVLAAWHVARTLCAEAPETARAHCDFSTAGTIAY